MKVLIVGWYGTETIGDRGILASLIMHFSQLCKCEFTIASIYPFFTTRTIKEDASFISKISNVPVKDIENIQIVDSRDYWQFKKSIDNTDCVVMGGGPLDDMASMYMIQYAMYRAKMKKKMSLLYGIGLNVLKNKKYQKSAREILFNSEYVIFRDKKSIDICKLINADIEKKYSISIDPAVFSCVAYKEINKANKESNYCAINLREFPEIYSNGNRIDIDFKAETVISTFLSGKNEEIIFVPMNYFDAGIDDRIILNRFLLKHPEIKGHVVRKPLSLEETFSVYMNAKYCIGMRFHAVVFQTILNGNNYILDYTDPQKGKITGFIEQIDGSTFYNNRTIALQTLDSDKTLSLTNDRFICQKELIGNYESIYIKCLRDRYV